MSLVNWHRQISQYSLANLTSNSLFKDWKKIDFSILYVVLILISIGTVMNMSTSIYFAEKRWGDGYFLFKKQFFYVVLGISLMLLSLLVSVKNWFQMAPYLILLGIAGLIIVLIPSIGVKVNGSRRWLNFGVFTVQVVEPVKLVLIMYLSSYLVRKNDELRNSWRGFVKPLIVLSVISLLLLLQPDFGSTVIMVSLTLGLIFIANIPIHRLLILLSAVGASLWMILLQSPYRLERLKSYANPWDDPFNHGYQLIQSLIAFGQGKWLGTGLGNSLQKLFYLPEAHTDFVFAIIAEELGFVGAFLVLLLFAILIVKILTIAKHIAEGKRVYQVKNSTKRYNYHYFCAYFCYGVVLFVAGHVSINIAMVTGLIPTKGLTLPFISYGGSSLMTCLLMVGIVLRITAEFVVKEELSDKKSEVIGVKKNWVGLYE